MKDTYTEEYTDSEDGEIDSEENCSCGGCEDCDGEGCEDCEDEGCSDCCGGSGCCEQNSTAQTLETQIQQAYLDGFSVGKKDGKGHTVRRFYVTDTDDKSLSDDEVSYINGYNDGYRHGRYSKS
jgi:hypothetical protein